MTVNTKTINEKSVVTLSYTLSIMHPNGELEFIEKRSVQDPLEFVYGKGIVLPQLEQALHGKTMGYEGVVKLRPEDAFGLREESLIMVYPIDKLPRDPRPQVGMKYQTQGRHGDVISVLVTNVDEQNNTVTLDGNHPLADAFLQFDVSVLMVRPATEQEVASGVVDLPKLH